MHTNRNISYFEVLMILLAYENVRNLHWVFPITVLVSRKLLPYLVYILHLKEKNLSYVFKPEYKLYIYSSKKTDDNHSMI